METLKDLKDTDFVNFTGTAIYKKKLDGNSKATFLNLGQVYGISEVLVNGKSCGIQWYGKRVYNIAPFMQKDANDLEIRVTTTMGNYMKTLKDNKTAQKFTNRPSREQPTQSMGLAGPVTVY